MLKLNIKTLVIQWFTASALLFLACQAQAADLDPVEASTLAGILDLGTVANVYAALVLFSSSSSGLDTILRRIGGKRRK
jgi:hypothetical protein